MNEEELKPCPICGNDIVTWFRMDNSFTCSECGSVVASEYIHSIFAFKEISYLKAALQAKDAEIAELKESLSKEVGISDELFSLLETERSRSEKLVQALDKIAFGSLEKNFHKLTTDKPDREIALEALEAHRKPEEAGKP